MVNLGDQVIDVDQVAQVNLDRHIPNSSPHNNGMSYTHYIPVVHPTYTSALRHYTSHQTCVKISYSSSCTQPERDCQSYSQFYHLYQYDTIHNCIDSYNWFHNGIPT